MERKNGKWLCSNCSKPLVSGYYFETDCTGYCSKECLLQKMSWEEYLAIHDQGHGDAYWTVWPRSPEEEDGS